MNHKNVIDLDKTIPNQKLKDISLIIVWCCPKRLQQFRDKSMTKKSHATSNLN